IQLVISPHPKPLSHGRWAYFLGVKRSVPRLCRTAIIPNPVTIPHLFVESAKSDFALLAGGFQSVGGLWDRRCIEPDLV
ncbi:MAG: hypothetical protein SAJ72_24315, partial [Jaaginema sp. PMC 1080.18]|nr:hypothetical protein [Jaaginema sp. PMC 1080.18]MEC4869086.1 hypothetical protein [Jaaginema sp. PMC 1078.18]